MTWQMDHSDMDPSWIEQMWGRFPCEQIKDAAGAPNGNYRTGPVRGSFIHLFERSKPIAPNPTGKYTFTALFPPSADLSVLKQAATAAALEKWPRAGQSDGPTLHSPFRQQTEKAKFDGYKNEGGVFITAVADQRQPYIVDAQGAPITDPKLVQSGFWYLAVVRPFVFDAGMKKGVSFGINGVMLIAKDKEFGGGGSNPAADFAGVQIDTSAQAAAVNPGALF